MRPCQRRHRRRYSRPDQLIQRLTSPDPARLARLADIHRAAFAPISRAWSGGEIADLAAAGILLVDDADRGFALFSRAVDEVELLTVAVQPDHQRRGLARDLLTMAERVLRSIGVIRIHLEVAADNPGALALYEALGYRVNGRRKQYYRRASGDRIDAVVMAKDLGPA